MRTPEVETDVELSSVRAKITVEEVKVSTLQSSLKKKRKVSQERLESLDTVANDAVVAAHAKLM